MLLDRQARWLYRGRGLAWLESNQHTHYASGCPTHGSARLPHGHPGRPARPARGRSHLRSRGSYRAYRWVTSSDSRRSLRLRRASGQYSLGLDDCSNSRQTSGQIIRSNCSWRSGYRGLSHRSDRRLSRHCFFDCAPRGRECQNSHRSWGSTANLKPPSICQPGDEGPFRSRCKPTPANRRPDTAPGQS